MCQRAQQANFQIILRAFKMKHGFSTFLSFGAVAISNEKLYVLDVQINCLYFWGTLKDI